MKFLLILGLWVTSSFCVTAGPYDSIIEHALGSSALVQKALDQSQELHQKTNLALEGLQKQIKGAAEDSYVEAKDMVTALHQRFQEDLQSFERMAPALELLKAGIEATWGLKTHKMAFATKAAANLLGNQHTVASLLSGQTLPDYDYLSAPACAVLDAGFYGTTQGTNFKTALLSVLKELNKKSSVVEVFDQGMKDIDESTFVHVTPLPVSLQETLVGSAYYVPNYFEGKPGFLTVHNGYAFGGHRSEPRYPQGKPFGPEDCSSWVASITGCKILFSTMDQWGFYGHSQRLLSDKMDSFEALSQCFAPVSGLEDVKPGDVYVCRTFKEGGSALGSGGHTAMVLGREGTDIITLGYNRGLPEKQLDGFGIQVFPHVDTAEKKVFFLRAQEQ